MDIVSSVVASIREAELPAELYRTARELLDLAGDNGQVKISRDAMMAICKTQADGTMRRQLYALKKANIVHVSINEHVHVSFVGFPTVDQMITPRASEITARAPEITPRARESFDDTVGTPYDDDQKITARAPEITPRALEITPRALPHTRGVSLFVSDPIPSSDEEPTNKLTLPGQRRQPWEARLSFRLLTDKRVAVGPRIADRLAADHSYWEVRDAVAHWYTGRELVGGKFANTCGIVIKWLDNPQDFVVPTLSEEFRQTGLYRDYRTPDELAAEQAALDEAQRLTEQESEEAREDPPTAASPDLRYEPDEGTPAWAWEQLQQELAADRWLDGTHVLHYEYETNQFVIGLPDASREDWIVKQLSKQIKRKLRVITGREADVTFIITAPGSVSRETQGDST